MAFDPEDGSAYTGLADGRIVHLSSNGEFLSTVFFSGGFQASDLKARTNGVSAETAEKMDWCKKEALEHRLAWDKEGEKSCGRPLGMRFLPKGAVVSKSCNGIPCCYHHFTIKYTKMPPWRVLFMHFAATYVISLERPYIYLYINALNCRLLP
jgi:hypothetical protein